MNARVVDATGLEGVYSFWLFSVDAMNAPEGWFMMNPRFKDTRQLAEEQLGLRLELRR
jgi:hypothetical protein